MIGKNESTGTMSTVYHTESFELHADAIGESFLIEVSLPDGYQADGEKQWPIAYVLDGNLAFQLASTVNSLCGRDLLDPSVEAAIVVGIGYPNPKELSYKRVRDLTPPGSVDDWFADVYKPLTGKRAESGGADHFLAFIQDTVHTTICEKYRCVPDTAAIFGDSYGGLFTYYALLQEAPLFDRFWIGSPGVFGAGLPLLERLPARLDAGFNRPTRIMMTVGSEERYLSSGSAPPIYQEMARSYDEIVRQLKGFGGDNLALGIREYEGHTHTSVFAPALTDAWRFLMQRT